MKILKNKLNILSLITIILITIFYYYLIKLNLLNNKLLLLIILPLTLLTILTIILLNINKKIFKIISIMLSIILIAISSIGTYYLNITNNYLEETFKEETTTKYTYYIISNKKNNYNKNNIKENLYYYKDINNKEDIIKNINNKYDVNISSYKDIGTLFNDLNNNKIKLIFVEDKDYKLIFNLDKNLNKDDFTIIDKITINEKKEINNEIKDTFNIYIGGTDFTNVCMDFNMIVTINTKTHEILLTSIPRDYYVNVNGKNGKDTLSFIGAYGIDTSIKSLEDLFNIKIDYYIKIKAESLVKVVDAIGGINFCSDTSYYTTHALIINDYNDKGKKKLHIKKGCQHLNGIETLTVARERKHLKNADRGRQSNCRQIIMEIFNKLKQPSTLLNYNYVLDSFNGLYESNIPRTLITKLVKETLNNTNWNIIEQQVDGVGGTNKVHLTDLKSWVMYPDEQMVNKASEEINKILNNK